MGLFDKKYCDVCGEKIGLLGNRKLEDGNLCKSCASKLSPWFTGRRHSALANIKCQIEDREANKARVAAFRRSQKLGSDGRALYLDEVQGSFAVCYESDWKTGNPDILPLSAVTACRYECEEHRTERKRRDANGNMVSFTPPVYDYSYDYHIVIDVDHPYIDELKFRVNNMSINRSGGSILSGGDRRIMEYEELCRKIVATLQGESKPSASQNERTLELREIMSPYHTKDPGGAYDLVVTLSVKGSVTVSVTDEAIFDEQRTVDLVGNVVNKCIMELERECIEVHSVDAKLLSERLTAAANSVGLQQFGLDVRGASLVPSIDSASEQMMQRMIDAKQRLDAMNASSASGASAVTAPIPAASVSRVWVCPACTAENEGGKFCIYCGSPRP
ncbi:MAG: DUF4428 domain-containing protein [Oscillospiraceae bacterium]|nr:DUF4428 domain-containing protein [Oscillospiraceae bacterium]